MELKVNGKRQRLAWGRYANDQISLRLVTADDPSEFVFATQCVQGTEIDVHKEIVPIGHATMMALVSAGVAERTGRTAGTQMVPVLRLLVEPQGLCKTYEEETGVKNPAVAGQGA